MKVLFNEVEMEFGGPLMSELEDSAPDINDVETLQARMAEKGYLFLRGFHDRQAIAAARTKILEHAQNNGILDTAAPLSEGRCAQGLKGAFWGGRKEITHTPEMLGILENERLMAFFAKFLGGDVMTYPYKWLRLTAPGEFTLPHYDVVYMGRGSHNVFTCWTAYHDIPLERGPLAICEGSHRFDRVKQTYGRVDVDKQLVGGYFPAAPTEIVQKLGGHWRTASMQPGDIIIFGLFTMHASLTNQTHEFRITTDTRYQLAAEPADDRWMGDTPPAHYGRAAAAEIHDLMDHRAEYGLV